MGNMIAVTCITRYEPDNCCSVLSCSVLSLSSCTADWHALELTYGQFCSFYGNQCRHFAKPNDTGKTRVSLDFRAVSELSGGHDPKFDKGIRRGSKARYQRVFDVNGFYSECFIASS